MNAHTTTTRQPVEGTSDLVSGVDSLALRIVGTIVVIALFVGAMYLCSLWALLENMKITY